MIKIRFNYKINNKNKQVTFKSNNNNLDIFYRYIEGLPINQYKVTIYYPDYISVKKFKRKAV